MKSVYPNLDQVRKILRILRCTGVSNSYMNLIRSANKPLEGRTFGEVEGKGFLGLLWAGGDVLEDRVYGRKVWQEKGILRDVKQVLRRSRLEEGSKMIFCETKLQGS